MADWTPKVAGRAFEYSRILKPLEKFREDTLVFSGPRAPERLRARRRSRRPRARRRVVPDRRAPARRPPARTSRTASPSIRSRRSSWARRRASARSKSAATTRARSATATPGYSCAYTNSLAWRGPATPMPPETNPRLVFERLFGDIDTSLSPEVRARRLLLPSQHPRPRRRAHAESSRPASVPPTSGSSTSTCRPSARSSSASSGPRRT